uniref:Uncharacterized protein n=1 Tax=Anguilla anguilla TaxID=7936 RepID=A0A0E9P9X2_ANGAN
MQCIGKCALFYTSSLLLFHIRIHNHVRLTRPSLTLSFCFPNFTLSGLSLQEFHWRRERRQYGIPRIPC